MSLQQTNSESSASLEENFHVMFSANLVLSYFYLLLTLLFILPFNKLFSGLLSVSVMDLKDLLVWDRNSRHFSNKLFPIAFLDVFLFRVVLQMSWFLDVKQDLDHLCNSASKISRFHWKKQWDLLVTSNVLYIFHSLFHADLTEIKWYKQR